MVITVVCDVLGETTNGTSLAAYNLINSLKQKKPRYFITLTLESLKENE